MLSKTKRKKTGDACVGVCLRPEGVRISSIVRQLKKRALNGRDEATTTVDRVLIRSKGIERRNGRSLPFAQAGTNGTTIKQSQNKAVRSTSGGILHCAQVQGGIVLSKFAFSDQQQYRRTIICIRNSRKKSNPIEKGKNNYITSNGSFRVFLLRIF